MSKLFYGVIVDRFGTCEDGFGYEKYPYHKVENFADARDLSDDYVNGGMVGVAIHLENCAEPTGDWRLKEFKPELLSEEIDGAMSRLAPHIVEEIRAELGILEGPKLYLIS